MTELVFIRHGETDWNREHRFQGQLDVPLNAVGLAQAQRVSARLANERFDALFSSDLQRALQTAAPLAVGRGLPALPRRGLREQHFGVFEGLTATTLRDRHPLLWQNWVAQGADFALPEGGESLRQFQRRVLDAVAELTDEMRGKRVAVVTHGGVLDMLWRSAHALPLDGPRACDIPNAGINRLRWADGALRIDSWADAKHLQGLPEQPSTRPARA